MPVSPFFGVGSPAKIDFRKRGTLILTSLLEDLEFLGCGCASLALRGRVFGKYLR